MKRRWRRWLLGIGICALVLTPPIILLSRWMNGSATGSVQVGVPARQSSAPAPSPLHIDTPYFTTVLPAGFSLKRQTAAPASSPTRLQLMADGGTNDQEVFAATVGTLPPEGLSGISDYNLRATATATYVRYVPAGLPAGAVAFRAVSGPPAFVVFWPRATSYTELSFSSDGSTTLDQLQALYQQVLAKWQWK